MEPKKVTQVVDNESIICVVKNPVYHSKTKHIEIRHHFIRDSYEKKLIEMVKIHTDYNVADLLTKAFDVTRISKIDCLLSSEVGDEAVHKELGDRMERAATTASSLEAEQDSGSGPSNHMANLEFCDKHNMIAYLQKSEGSEGFHQIIDFLNDSHIQYSLIENPTIYVSFIKQFCRTSTARISATGEVELTATIDGQEKTITEASLRRHLKLEDNGGVTTLPNSEIFEQLALMGMQLILINLHFKRFSSNIATAIICLATTRTFNFSKFIFDAMVKNLDNPHKFLMYPRFIQICLNKQRRLLQPHTRTFPTPVLTQKVFSNMKRVTKGYSREDIPLFASMITASETSPLRITSSPSLSPQHTPFTAPSTSQPSNIQTTPVTEEAASMPHESPL
ncbi:hypothetical protein Tco_0951695 [Tanacetum coccineum]|uniref:Uncharacterized protein n=1 Tax=Tanacetum coccineum TaxID=301880 RepID=A0ABQ5DUW1_9ASTR